METIAGINIFPIISFIIFFLFFLVLFIWVAKIRKSEINELAAMPLDDNNTNQSEPLEIEITNETNKYEK